MHVNGSDFIATKRFELNSTFQKPYLNSLHHIIENDILPSLDAAHIDGSLRGILENIEAVEDIVQVAVRIAAVEDRLSVILDELAHQACVAGIQWEEDQIDFCDVTDRIGRLQILACQLSAMRAHTSPPTGQSILLMPSPLETHVFGLQLLGMAFRDAGWTVTRPALTSEWLGERLAHSPYDVVGLSLSNVGLLPLLRDEIPRLRRASRNQSLCVLVGGPCFDRGDADFHSVGADAYAPDACSAPAIVGEIVNEQKLICARSAIS